MTVEITGTTEGWEALAASCLAYYATGEQAQPGRDQRWFAAVSALDHGELNVCGLLPGADPDDAQAVATRLEPDLPGIVFVSEHARRGATAPLTAAGFEVGTEVEPLMACATAPDASPGAYAVEQVRGVEALAITVPLMAEAHHIPADLVATVVRAALGTGLAVPWLARLDGEPVSVVWLVRAGDRLVVNEMMTPQRFQGRGAGRALLSAALASSWDGGVRQAVLLSTAAGRRLYTSLGFTVVDEVRTAFRGLDDEVLAAIGQTADQRQPEEQTR